MSIEPQYTYFRIDFEDWPEDFDYTICETLKEVHNWLKFSEIYLDDDTRKTKIIITGIAMTRKEYREFKKSNTKQNTLK